MKPSKPETMETLTVNVYPFDELSEEAKDNAREWMRSCLDTNDCFGGTIEDAKQASLTIEGWDIGRGQVCELRFNDSAKATADLILANHGETCDTYSAAKDWKDKADALALRINAGDIDEQDAQDEADENKAEFLKELSECYLTMLTDEYEAAQEDEYIDEAIRINEYLFTEKGKRTFTI